MPKKKPSSKKKTTTKTVDPTQRPRRLSLPKRVWYKPLTWRFSPPAPVYKRLPEARHLFMTSLRLLWQRKKLFGGIITIYGLLNIILVRGLSGSSDLATIKSNLDGALHGFGGKAVESAVSFGYLITTSGSGSATNSGPYQSLLFITVSLAFIWALRQTLAKRPVRIRDSFYEGMYPLVPFILLLLLAAVQLLPALIGGGLYQVVSTNGIAVHTWEKALWLALFIGGVLWSLRMITVTIFACYIVTLPGMPPLRAYRSARQLVYKRRLLIWRKLIFLPIVLLLLAAVIEMPLIMWLTPAAEWAFFVLSMVALPVVHSYTYALYREMI